MSISDETILSCITNALQRRDEALRDERAPLGIDSWDELAFHPLIEDAIHAEGMGVYREFPYPGLPGKRAKKTVRERCDLVITKHDWLRPRDPMEALNEIDNAPLFASAVGDSIPGMSIDIHTGEVILTPIVTTTHGKPPLTACSLDDCYFLEVKALGQFTYVDGVPCPNTRYASELIGALSKDLKKLNNDERIMQGGVLLLLFTATEDVAEHDLPAALHRTLDKGVPFRSPRWQGFPIADRVGNGWLTVLLTSKFL